jgi:hypothetical protein
MKKFLFSGFILLFLISQITYPQTRIDKISAPKELILKVSQFGQFVKRFNYDEDFWGKPISSSFAKKVTRQNYINFLFNISDSRLDTTSSSYSKEYRALKDEFISFVVNNNYKINRTSDSLYTIAECEVVYHKTPATLKLILKQQFINKGLAWVIADVGDGFFYDADYDPGTMSFIPPTSNEVNYIHLKSFFEKKDSLANYAYPGYRCNRLSIFFHMLHNDEIRYNFVKSITYFICDIPGWIVQVREYNREGDNSGWLIENVTRNSQPMDEYIRSITRK